MKKIFILIVVLVATLSLFGCSREKENEKVINFYLSQPRDPELAGWWAEQHVSTNDTTFTYFDLNGIVLETTTFPDGTIHNNRGKKVKDYWYTKCNICYNFFPNNSYFKGYSLEYHFKYEIRNDSLWIGFDDDNYKLKLWAIKTSSVTIDRLIN